jgi:hypothetical protein
VDLVVIAAEAAGDLGGVRGLAVLGFVEGDRERVDGARRGGGGEGHEGRAVNAAREKDAHRDVGDEHEANGVAEDRADGFDRGVEARLLGRDG